jgi:hypothetical protein
MKTSRAIQDWYPSGPINPVKALQSTENASSTDYFKVEDGYQEGAPHAVRLDRP